MTRPEKTKFLSDLLVRTRLNSRGVYWSSEVTINYGRQGECRVDFMQFKPQNQSVSGIEKGEFTCYEVKSCKADFHSGNGVNFIGDKNYVVTDMQTYKTIMNELPHFVGAMVAVPKGLHSTDEKFQEFQDPTPLEADCDWEFYIIKQSRQNDRTHPLSELLFCMFRSGK